MIKTSTSRLRWLAGLSLAAALTGTVAAEPLSYALPDETAEFRPGPQPGFDAARDNCMVCHSVDYINTQPPGKGPAFWQGEVQKMIHVYHAPISEEDAKAIAAYLAATY
ncbi:sulfite dehydrogenase (cytochrome) subunit SorB [Ancylobacter aquaticus]|uniref:Sulfite dehydrogenase (Cytochrome) subunit SorB n=1 Tax=Ancylobacter aquaticus TaxID=100 RepID=A0A4R1H664_ANCAQ|nr:cytochrome c [Ancylobacter aquaticus]TCK16618.1 sulfite dehydrogenase (cytochrome) subunit SorB [Ancylobacter aquaticus]